MSKTSANVGGFSSMFDYPSVTLAKKMVRNPTEHIVHYLLRGASTTWFIGDYSCPTKKNQRLLNTAQCVTS